MKSKRETVFLLGVLLAGLLTIFAYGSYLDQESEQRILFANIKEYMLYLPGDTPALVDELSDFGVLEISIDEDRDHGMAAFYPAFIVWHLNKLSPYWGSVFWHAYTFLLVFWGMCSLFYLGKELFRSSRTAAFTVLLFFLTPRMFAESHYNNKDMVLLSLCFTLFYWGMRLIRDTSWKSVVVFALAGALAANMKIIGIWIFGALGLYALLCLLFTRRLTPKLLIKAIACVLLWAFLYLLLTPACWKDMGGFFQYLIRYAVDYDLWHDYVLFNGNMLHQEYTGMPRKYLPVLMLLTIPPVILLLTALGCIIAAVDLFKKRPLSGQAGYCLVIVAAGGVPLLYAILAATPLYNGWRHFYFVYASMITAAGYGCSRLADYCRKINKTRVLHICALAYLLTLAAGIAWNYPQEHSYYNLLAGSNVPERYELDYWDLSVKQAYEAIADHAPQDRPVTVSALNLPTMWGLTGNHKVLPVSLSDRLVVTDAWETAEYLIINTTYANMYSKEQYQQVAGSYSLVEDFRSYGNVICEIYHKGERP